MKKRGSGDNSINPEFLRTTVERIVELSDEIDGLKGDIKTFLDEAKERGMKPAVIRRLVKELREDSVKRAEREAELEAYRAALGPLSDTPLGKAGAPR